jgi:hypothetical protein
MREDAMTAQQYLQSQAEYCRRAAADSADPFVAEELRRLAAEFDRGSRDEMRTPFRPESQAA